MSEISALTQRHRAQQLLLRTATIEQFTKLWPALDWAHLDASYPAFAVHAAALVETHRRTSAGLSVAYIRALRRAAGIAGVPQIVLADPLNVEQFQAALHSTSVAAIKGSTGRGVPAEIALSSALSQAQGAVTRLVLNGGRETVIASMAADDRIVGYRRVLGGGGCDFCQELAGRIYPSDNADFPAHGKCACSAEVVFD